VGRYVVVFLGDLGRDLPYEERLHWRQFNILPEGGISESNYRRSFLAQFSEAGASDLVFRQEYSDFKAAWNASVGWPLYLELGVGDEHILGSIRVPVTNSQAEMDEQVLFLTKLLVDSLNEAELAKRCSNVEPGAKGIAKLETFFTESKFEQGANVVQFLRDLQSLRSTGSGHRKGVGYGKMMAKLGLDAGRKPDGVKRILDEATAALRAVRMHYINTT
jgi:hypothetical protein